MTTVIINHCAKAGDEREESVYGKRQYLSVRYNMSDDGLLLDGRDHETCVTTSPSQTRPEKFSRQAKGETQDSSGRVVENVEARRSGSSGALLRRN